MNYFLFKLISIIALVALIILSVDSHVKLTCQRLQKGYITCQKEDKTFPFLFSGLPNSSQSFRIVSTELKTKQHIE